jgi:hypothetical protein
MRAVQHNNFWLDLRDMSVRMTISVPSGKGDQQKEYPVITIRAV